jgi:hypothetical protein
LRSKPQNSVTALSDLQLRDRLNRLEQLHILPEHRVQPDLTSTGKLDETPTAKLVPLVLTDIQPPAANVAPLKAFSLQNPSQRYDGCSITIQVPKDFYREKDLLTIFDGAMPGLAVEMKRRAGLSASILFAVGIAGNGNVLWNAKETLKSFLAQQ